MELNLRNERGERERERERERMVEFGGLRKSIMIFGGTRVYSEKCDIPARTELGILYVYTHIHTYINTYLYVCVCICTYENNLKSKFALIDREVVLYCQVIINLMNLLFVYFVL